MTEIIFDENEDWEKRILCSDESCIGTIGPDGKCKECGKPYEGKLPEGKINEIVHEVSSEKQVSPDDQADDDWDKRVLCSDGSCIGVIGPDGKCKECGKPL
ncbi:MAG TPA: hypothetical protein PK004_07255 [Smithella sp.]|nr:hypothetical protein [Smithella sp.]